jgi:Cdc6-like AAA superfamily ATPase
MYYEKKGLCIIKSRSATACVNTVTKKITLGFKTSALKTSGSKGRSIGKRNTTILMAFVRLAISLCTVLKGGLPFHSSAMVFGDQGIVFSGPSGAGKSTIAKLLVSQASSSKAIPLLNDDFNIILPRGKNSYGIYSTPFTQTETLKKCVRRDAELHTIFFIEKGMTNIIENLSFKNKYILVLGQTFIFPTSDFFARKILDNAEKICSTVECRRLFFRNDRSFVPFIDRYAKGLL